MFLNIIYVFATISLLTGSILSFDDRLSDYFFIVGFSFFCINSIVNLLCETRDKIKAYPHSTAYNNI